MCACYVTFVTGHVRSCDQPVVMVLLLWFSVAMAFVAMVFCCHGNLLLANNIHTHVLVSGLIHVLHHELGYLFSHRRASVAEFLAS